MVKKIIIGYAGGGYPAIEQLKGCKKIEGLEVAALCDVNPENLKKVADEFNIPKRFTNFDEMLALKELDAVSICTPNFLHVSQIIKALNAGKHVLCEKPLSVNAAEAKKIIEPLKKSRKIFMIAQLRRFSNEAKYLKSLIENNELGKIYYTKARIVLRSGIPGLGGWFTNKKLSGGGALIDVGVHLLDLTWWLMGCPEPETVYGCAYAEFGPRKLRSFEWGVSKITSTHFDVEDLVVGMIKFKNKATLHFEAAWALNIDKSNYVHTSIFGTEAGAELSLTYPLGSLTLSKFKEGCPVVIKPEITQNDWFEEEVRHFVNCVRDNKQPLVTSRQGVTVMKMIDAVYESAKKGVSIRIN
ncbi:MAG: hypothetical protein A2252_02295 [Elusimicrobia bacterium RIFOXYA2_FULL_39_19]|nr:MAG: hypothetical protein A2252_02295 [Elusimicrobia bacterium RIFOXYA2_FULL_39_19]